MTIEKALEDVQRRLHENRLDQKAVQRLTHLLVASISEDNYREVVEQHPHESRRAERLMGIGRELIVDLHLLLGLDGENAKKLLALWIRRWQEYQSHECQLLFDGFYTDLGCPH